MYVTPSYSLILGYLTRSAAHDQSNAAIEIIRVPHVSQR